MSRTGEASLERFLDDIGRHSPGLEIVTGEDCASRYRDPFALSRDQGGAPAAVRPAAVGDVQEIVRAANRVGMTLWPISRGENLGYGGAAACDGASVILDLSRMNRILEVNVPDAYCLVEPGVSFVDMFEHLERLGLPLWLSVPGYGLGSLVGNALERGTGHSPYGDHAAQICGMEIVLGDGELVRTGMGALPGSGMWQRQRAALGPRFDELFVQSSFGIVTKMGLWLMPEPAASAAVEIRLEERDTLAALVEALARLKRSGVIEDSPAIANYLTEAALRSARTDWIGRGERLDGEAERRICEALGLGWWNAKLRLYGLPDLVELRLRHIVEALRPLPGCTFQVSRWQQGEPMSNAHRGVPSEAGLANVQWCGEFGAHIDFAVALPLSGAEALRHTLLVRDALARAGADYHSAFYLRDRHILNVVQILFDREDLGMCDSIDAAYRHLIAETADRGLGVYRVPLRYRARAMAEFSFGGNALAGLGGRVKRALDPKAILSPGKDGYH